MASFTGVGDSVELEVPLKGTDVDIAISGTYNMTILFQVERGSPGSGAWHTINTYSTEDATVAAVYTTKSWNEKVRLTVTVDTSGTATATLTESDDKVVRDFRDPQGTRRFQVTEDAVDIPFGIRRSSGAIVDISADTTLTANAHAGRLLTLSKANGVTVTLPPATGSGNVYRFLVRVTVTSNDDIIQVSSSGEEFLGTLYQIDADSSDAIAAYPCLAADNFDTITLNGSTKGGIKGDYIWIEDVIANQFLIGGTVTATGTVASMLSAAV